MPARFELVKQSLDTNTTPESGGLGHACASEVGEIPELGSLLNLRVCSVEGTRGTQGIE